MQTNYSNFNYRDKQTPSEMTNENSSSKAEEKSQISKKIPNSPETASNRNFNIKELDIDTSNDEVLKAQTQASRVFHLPREKNILLEKLQEKVSKIYKKTIQNLPHDQQARQNYLDWANKSKNALDKFVSIIKDIETISIPEDSSKEVLRFKDSGLKLERYPDGKLYAQLNVFIGKGAHKVVKISVDLSTLEPDVARATIKLHEKTPDIENEIKMQNLLDEPEFVRILATCSYVGKNKTPKFGIMMEICDGGNLRQIGEENLEKIHPDIQKLYWKFAESFISGLKKMDAKNIKHRDLKPDNLVIKIDESGEKHLKIADFGYAITSDAKADDAVKFVGTPTYIPPEIFEAYSLLNEGKKLSSTGKEDQIAKGQEMIQKAIQIAVSPKGDMWAAGLILLELRMASIASLPEMLDATNANALYERILSLEQNEIREWFSKDVSEEGPIKSIEDLIYRMLQKDPDKRISAKEAWEAFQALEKNDHNFCISQSELNHWINKLYPDSDDSQEEEEIE